jgi:hypothetical protein
VQKCSPSRIRKTARPKIVLHLLPGGGADPRLFDSGVHGFRALRNSDNHEKSPVFLSGMVTELLIANPQTHTHFDVKSRKWTIVHWACETLEPLILPILGRPRATRKPREEITVTFDPAKSNYPVGYL